MSRKAAAPAASRAVAKTMPRRSPRLKVIVDAWQDSAFTPVGYPMVNVREIESGKVRATRDLFGAD